MPGSTRSYEMATRLALKGHEVHIISSKRDSSQIRRKRIKGKIFEGYWLAPHDLSFVLDLLEDEPEAVFCGFRPNTNQKSFNYDLYFKDGLVARFESSFAIKDSLNAGNMNASIRIIGDLATIEAYDSPINIFKSTSWESKYPDIHEWQNICPLNRGYLGSPVIDFINSVANKKFALNSNHSIEKSLIIQKIINLLEQSSKESRIIDNK